MQTWTLWLHHTCFYIFTGKYLTTITLRVKFILGWTVTTIIFQTVWHLASANSLKFSHDNHNKDNDWIFSPNEISISNTNQTIQWPIAVCVCRARFCSKQNKHFNKEDSAFKHYLCRIAYQCLLLLVFKALSYCPRIL